MLHLLHLYAAAAAAPSHVIETVQVYQAEDNSEKFQKQKLELVNLFLESFEIIGGEREPDLENQQETRIDFQET